jgi:MarR family transcriptional regulator, organic hydroperoxide resistance regulator
VISHARSRQEKPMTYDQLKLDNQLCFPVYAASRLITREYQPYLDTLGITYPQYLVLLVLWEAAPQTVTDIAQKLILNTNTITPLLKRMEKQGIIVRERSRDDERIVVLHLTEKGKRMRTAAAKIPEQLSRGIRSDGMTIGELTELKERLSVLIHYLNSKGV